MMLGIIFPYFLNDNSLSKACFILVVIKFIDQRVKTNPGRSKKIKLIALKKYILIFSITVIFVLEISEVFLSLVGTFCL